jgi:uncharacterized protein (TIGR02145 family)
MKRIILLTVIVALFIGCKEENKAPTCKITSPHNGAEIQQGTTIKISVDAEDTDGYITEVRFYVNETGVGSSNSYPYNFIWNTSNLGADRYKIKASSLDNEGNLTSSEIKIYLVIRDTGTITDYDGNVYNTIKYGDQWWMTENLRTTHYSNGDRITHVAFYWHELGSEDIAMCYYNNNANGESETYGALYTWEAAMNASESSDENPSNVQGVCPSGWHLPSDTEWKELEMYLGMSSSEAENAGERGTNEGSKLAGGSILWEDGVLENDFMFGTSDFNALPGGLRVSDFNYLGEWATFWTSTEYNTDQAYKRDIYNYSSRVRRDVNKKTYGISVRCVKD